MEWLWLTLFLVILIHVLTVARRAHVREMKELTPEEREEERYQMQIW